MLDQLIFIEPKPTSVVIGKVSNGSQAQLAVIAEALRERFPENRVLVLGDGVTLDIVDEAAMARHGWKRFDEADQVVIHAIDRAGVCTTCAGQCRDCAAAEARAH